MASLSLRIPDELVMRLERAAELEQRGRSEIVRDALDRYLEDKARERFLADMVREARAVYADPAALREAGQLGEDFLAAENEALDRAESGGRSGTRRAAARGKWWR